MSAAADMLDRLRATAPSNDDAIASSVRTLAQDTAALAVLERSPTPGELAAVERRVSDVRALVVPIADTGVGSSWKALDPDLLSTAPPPRRWLFRHPTRNGGECAPSEGDGLLPLGKAGLLVADGGVGKTMVLVAGACSIIVGRPWLGHFHVAHEARGGAVLLVLAEEDAEEVHRRLYSVAQAMRLTTAERALIAANLIVLPMAGKPIALVAPVDGRIIETAELVEIRRRLASRDRWALVALDPLARMAEGEIETSNDGATRAVQAIESLTAAPGNPTVLVAHHSSKDAVKNGRADARGVTAIRNGFRWEAAISVDKGAVTFLQTKSNYSRPMTEADALTLVRGEDGLLRVATEDDEREREARRDTAHTDAVHADILRVVAALRDVGELGSIDAIAAAAGMRQVTGRAAVHMAMARGFIVRGGTARAPKFVPADVPSVCAADPHTPGTSGRPEGTAAATSGTAMDVDGTSWTSSGSLTFQNGKGGRST